MNYFSLPPCPRTQQCGSRLQQGSLFYLIFTPKWGLMWISHRAGLYSSSIFMFSILESVLIQFLTVLELTKGCSELLDRFCNSPHWNRIGMASGLGFRFIANLIPGILKPSVSWALSVGSNLPGLYSFSSTTLWTWSLVGVCLFFLDFVSPHWDGCP